MAIDYSGGLSEDREYVFAEQPSDPEMRESVNTWVWDEGTDYGMPRIGVEAVADQWETHDIQFNLAFANGRILNMFGSGKVHDPLGADGKARILGAGPIEFELVKPFEHWKAHIQGRRIGHVDRSADRRRGSPARAPARWCRSSSSTTSGRRRRRGRAAASSRSRVVCSPPRKRVTSWVARASSSCSAPPARCASATTSTRSTVAVCASAAPASAGSPRSAGTCGSRRCSRAAAPSGCASIPTATTARTTFNEGFLFEGDGELIPAWVTDAPWLRDLAPKGQDTTVTLETEDGRTETISGHDRALDLHGDGRGERGQRSRRPRDGQLPAAAGRLPVHVGRRDGHRDDRALVGQQRRRLNLGARGDGSLRVRHHRRGDRPHGRSARTTRGPDRRVVRHRGGDRACPRARRCRRRARCARSGEG